MFLQLTTAAPPFIGNKILLNSEYIISVYTDEVRWVNKDNNTETEAFEKKLHTCIASYGVNGLNFVQESVEEVYALINTKN